MTRVIISPDDAAAESVAARIPGAVAVDIDGTFERVLAALLESVGVPSSATVDQIRRNAEARVAYLQRYGSLTAEALADLSGSQATNRRQTAHRWRRDDRVFAVYYGDSLRFPAFQFDDDGQPRSVIGAALAVLPDGLTGWALALWWDTPEVIDGQWVTPGEVLDNPDTVLALAAMTARQWPAGA